MIPEGAHLAGGFSTQRLHGKLGRIDPVQYAWESFHVEPFPARLILDFRTFTTTRVNGKFNRTPERA